MLLCRKFITVLFDLCYCPSEIVTWKYKFPFLELSRDYSNSFNLYNVAELSRNRIGRDSVLVKKENKIFTAVVC